jgi:hypothetical protein
MCVLRDVSSRALRSAPAVRCRPGIVVRGQIPRLRSGTKRRIARGMTLGGTPAFGAPSAACRAERATARRAVGEAGGEPPFRPQGGKRDRAPGLAGTRSTDVLRKLKTSHPPNPQVAQKQQALADSPQHRGLMFTLHGDWTNSEMRVWRAARQPAA